MTSRQTQLEVFRVSGSPYSWRVLLTLEAKPLDLGLLLDARYPRLAAWMQRIEQLPGYERTYVPHWRQ